LNTKPPSLSKFKKRITWDNLDKELLRKHLALCLEEDLGKNLFEKKNWELDITTNNCNSRSKGSAHFISRESMVICGVYLVPLILEAFGVEEIEFKPNANDGDSISQNQVIGELEGPENQILIVERCVLNFLQRLSGIATAARRYVRLVDKFGVGLLDTRKTTPGLRLLEKYASASGGSFNHRIGLFDRILIKDNHLAAVGATQGSKLENFLVSVVQKKEPEVIVEVEIDDISQLNPAINSGVDAILLDNFTPENIKQVVQNVKEKVVIEASGGISEENISIYAKSQPHFISTGAPVHSSRWVDIGLDWQ